MRRRPPGMQHRGGLQEERQVKNRVVIGQITSVDDADGAVTVTLQQTQEQVKVAVPLGGFAINGLRSSWMRYMPQEYEFVKIAYENDGTPLIVGYATFGENFDPKTERRGGGVAPRQSAYATARELARTNTNGMQIFRALRPGEWDMRSQGGAEIYGDRDGNLTLAGSGGAVIRLVKSRRELRGTADLHALSGTGIDFRIGDVKRAQPPFTIEQPAAAAVGTLQDALPPLGTGELQPKEHRIRVRAGTATYYELDTGDVRDDLGLPLFGSFGSPLRYRSRVYGISTGPGLSSVVCTVQVDALGNVAVTTPAGIVDVTATQIRLGGSTATEAGVLGNVLVNLLQTLTVPTAFGPSGTPINAASFPTALSALVRLR